MRIGHVFSFACLVFVFVDFILQTVIFGCVQLYTPDRMSPLSYHLLFLNASCIYSFWVLFFPDTAATFSALLTFFKSKVSEFYRHSCLKACHNNSHSVIC